MAILASSALEYIYLAKQLGFDVSIYLEEDRFVISYDDPKNCSIVNIAIHKETSVEVGVRHFNGVLRYLRVKYNVKQKISEEEERQALLDRLSDHEKKLLGLV